MQEASRGCSGASFLSRSRSQSSERIQASRQSSALSCLEPSNGLGRYRSMKSGKRSTQLDANPWLKFLIEVYPDGIVDIAAKKLFARYRVWCADEGRSGVLNQTKFGRKLGNLMAPRGLEVSCLPILKRLTKAGNRYDISPMREFDLALFFGLTAPMKGLTLHR